MIPHHVMCIHGIGDVDNDYSADLRTRLSDVFADEVNRVSQRVPAQGALECKETSWANITQPPQDELWNRLFPMMQARCRPLASEVYKPRNWWQRFKYWAALRRIVISHQGDLIAYIERPGANRYARIHDQLYSFFDACTASAIKSGATAQRPVLVTIVAHSLGCVIMSDLLYDVHVRRTRWWPSQIRLANFISLGCPLSLYSLRYELDGDEFQQALRMQDEYGAWINVGQWWNLKHLLLQSTPFNHNLYWEDRTVANIIGRKVALDWLRINQPDLEVRLKDEYQEFKPWVHRLRG